MTEIEKQSPVEKQREIYLHDLFSQALGGNRNAITELSGIALGGHPLAQSLVHKMDKQFSQGTNSNSLYNSRPEE